MSYESLALSFTIGLGFHALNNEGGGGTNVMEPRRITVGDQEHDGVSGEIVRRHILENFVRVAEKEGIALSRAGRGLRPDRGREDLVRWMSERKVTSLTPEHYAAATAELVASCAVRDVAGYLMALERATDKVEGTLKRDSVFEVGWLISVHPAAVEMTQHAAYSPDPGQHNLFVQNMRTGVYAGVLRVDLARIGRNDWAWLDGSEPYCVSEAERRRRADALLRAIEQFLVSPSGAKQAGWLQHTGVVAGAFVLSADGPAPFRSPLALRVVGDGEPPSVRVGLDEDYVDRLRELAERAGTRYRLIAFQDQAELVTAVAQVREVLAG